MMGNDGEWHVEFDEYLLISIKEWIEMVMSIDFPHLCWGTQRK